MVPRQSPPLCSFMLAVVVIAGLSDCGGEQKNPLAEYYDFAGVPLSDDLAPTVRASGARLALAGPDNRFTRDLVQYSDLEVRLQRPEERERAADALFALWGREPTHFLWMELAINYIRFHGRRAALDSMLASPLLADTTSAAGAFAFARADYLRGSRGEPYLKLETKRAELDSFQQVWLDLKLARLDSDQGRSLEGVRRLQSALPLAHRTAGCRLAARLWGQIRVLLQREDRLDDALYAAVMAEALAEKAGDDYYAVSARISRAGVLEKRREYAAALEQLEECIRTARERDYPWLVGRSLDDAASLCTELNDIEQALIYDRAVLAQNLAISDSLNAPRAMITVAHDHRLLGNLDSSLVYQREARLWVDAYHDAVNKAVLPIKEAEYFCQIGDYATAESLLTAAGGRSSELGAAGEEAEMLLGLIQQGLDLGRPDMAYRAIARVQTLAPMLFSGQPHLNLRADLEIATADLLARQGEFRLAAEALERARAAVDAYGGESKDWEYERCRGDLALLRQDFVTARKAYERGLAISVAAGDKARQATSQFRLGSALLQSGHYEEARQLFQDPLEAVPFGTPFRTRLSSLLFLGISHARQEHHEEALQHYRRVLELCTPSSPPDLVARLHIERGHSLAAIGRPREARAALLLARELLQREGTRSASADLWAFNRLARRDLAEALISLIADHPQLTGRRDATRYTLALAEECRRPGAGPALGARPGDNLQLDPHRDRTTTLVYFVGAARSFVWVIDEAETTRHQLPGRAALQDLLIPILVDMGQPERPVERSALQRLSDTLLGPLAGRWPAETTLRLVSDDILHEVPWSALLVRGEPETDKRVPVIEHGPISEALSLSLRQRKKRPGAPSELVLLALGCDSGEAKGVDADLLPLRRAEAEAEQIASLWPTGRAVLLTGENARWTTDLTAGLARYGVIHIASHAVIYQGLPHCSTLRLAVGGDTAPLTVNEISSLDLAADLIYLSCCETGRRLQRSSKGMADFAGAFLTAGAATVIASTERVDDEAAARLAAAFYRHWLAGTSKAAALRAAQLEVRSARPEWEHPFFWAAFRVLGAGD